MCVFYMRTGYCKYGRMCKFNHPNLTAANAPLPTSITPQQQHPTQTHISVMPGDTHDRSTTPTTTPAVTTSGTSAPSVVESTAAVAVVAGQTAMEVVDVAGVSPHLVQVKHLCVAEGIMVTGASGKCAGFLPTHRQATAVRPVSVAPTSGGERVCEGMAQAEKRDERNWE